MARNGQVAYTIVEKVYCGSIQACCTKTIPFLIRASAKRPRQNSRHGKSLRLNADAAFIHESEAIRVSFLVKIGVGLVAWLRATWVAVILPIISASVPSSKLSSFHELILGFAQRGKIRQPSSCKSKNVPRRFFSHFYVVASIWTTLLLLTAWLYAYAMAPMNSGPSHFSHLASHSHLTGGSHIFSLHESHSTLVEQYRVWRIVFVLMLMEAQISNHSSMFIYRIAAPLSLCCNCTPVVFRFTMTLVSKFIIEAKNQMTAIEIDWTATVDWWCSISMTLSCNPRFTVGRGHMLNKSMTVIPTADWLETVSSPHYLAEIVRSLFLHLSRLLTAGGKSGICSS
ncbi:LOW QUALITY PROTEIN: polyprenol reductase 2-like [Herrania umbratica]|uniref:LOW QUALITY PROTEIN: polyprenol reductase 2-like n=1 Tax=Herrania umbratica TaxID=108875 RepID=A0A6J1AHS9_9ROSI|nr:LOW QUALITY PROTEIN: polyprenol reductase 2-like [Herrania umbratica]